MWGSNLFDPCYILNSSSGHDASCPYKLLITYYFLLYSMSYLFFFYIVFPSSFFTLRYTLSAIRYNDLFKDFIFFLFYFIQAINVPFFLAKLSL